MRGIMRIIRLKDDEDDEDDEDENEDGALLLILLKSKHVCFCQIFHFSILQ